MRLATGSVGRSENSRGHGGVKSAPSLVLPIQFFPLCHLFSVTSKLPVVSYITLLFLLLQSAAVLEEPMNISTNSAVICWQKPVADSQVKLYTLKVEIDSGDISSSGGNTVFSADVPAGKNEDRFCQSVDNLEEDTKYVYTVIAVHINGLAIQNVDRGAFKTKANSCSTQVCSGGSCTNINEYPYFNCMCYLGYYGPACEQYNPCVNMPCNPYECINITTNQFECVCPNGDKYTDSSDCDERQRDPCKEEPCMNDGVCTNLGEGEFECACGDGYKGKVCEQMEKCQYVSCENGGKCREDSSAQLGFKCECPPGTAGMFCEVAGPCELVTCLNEGTCEVDMNSGDPKCKCAEGFIGENCELTDWCHKSRNPCKENSTCISDEGSDLAVCRCHEGYYGIHCQFYDYCAKDNMCNNHGECKLDTNNAKSEEPFTCLCDEGWSGNNCEDLNACIAQNPCQNGAQCTYLGHKNYSCSCVENSGFWGPNCQFYNQCHKSPCQNGGACRNITSDNNSENDYLCLCDANFEGKNCEILNPCKKENYCGQGSCTFKGHERATCDCQLGYYGERCEHYDVCKVRNPCQNGGFCEATADNGYQCRCVNGYSGPDCDKFDPCASKPCLNDGLCVPRDDRLGIYECKCKDDYASGYRCEYIDPCRDPKTCPNLFSCLNTTTGHAVCRPNDQSSIPMGVACNGDADCFNGGRCNKQGVCQCFPPYEGNRCENINPCNEPEICSRRGDCRRISQANAKCYCEDGFFGPRCQYEDKCLSKTCLNGGNCVLLTPTTDTQQGGQLLEGGGGGGGRGERIPKCHCRDGYSGDDCGTSNKECKLNLCENGGKCLTLGFVSPQHHEGFVCECPKEFYGSKCQHLRTCAATPPLDMKSIGALRWPQTPAGNTSRIVCPYGSRRPGGAEAIETGFASRVCMIRESPHRHIEVTWGEVNAKYCQNEPKTLRDANSIIDDMVKTVTETIPEEISTDLIRYTAQVLHNLLAAFTLTDRKSAQKHVQLVNSLMAAEPEVIFEAEANYSTSRTIVSDLEDLARRFVMATEERAHQVYSIVNNNSPSQTSSSFSPSSGSSEVVGGGSSTELANHRRVLILEGELVCIVIITQDALLAQQEGMSYTFKDGLISVRVPAEVFKSRSGSSPSSQFQPYSQKQSSGKSQISKREAFWSPPLPSPLSSSSGLPKLHTRETRQLNSFQNPNLSSTIFSKTEATDDNFNQVITQYQQFIISEDKTGNKKTTPDITKDGNTNSEDIADKKSYQNSVKNSHEIVRRQVKLSPPKQQRTHRLQIIIYKRDYFFNPAGATIVPGSSNSLDGLFFPESGRVVSVNLDGKSTVRDLKSKNSVEITFPNTADQKAEPLCVFWKEDARYWSQTGLVTRAYGRNGTTCQSSHLTTFTLFMRVMSGSGLEGEVAPSILPFVGTGLAIIAYTLTIITYCLFGSLRREASGNVVLSLAAALLLLNISFLAAAVRTRFQDQHLCNAVGVALHFFLLASVMWHVVDALFSYNNVSRPLVLSSPSPSPHGGGGGVNGNVVMGGSSAGGGMVMVPSSQMSVMAAAAGVHDANQVSTSLFIKCALFAWGMPLIITTPTIIIKQGNYDIRDIYCRLTPDLETTYYGALVLPCSVIILVGIGFHLIALKLVQSQSKQQSNQFQVQQVNYPSHERAFLESNRLNLVTMTFVLISFSVTWIYSQFFFRTSLPTFEFVFCCGNVFQSWCFFTSRCMLLREARDAWKMFFSAGEMKPHIVADGRHLKCNAYDDSVSHALLSNHNKAITPEKFQMTAANHNHSHLNGGRHSMESPYRHFDSNGHSGHAIPESIGYDSKDMAIIHRNSPLGSQGSQGAIIFGETMEIKKAAAQVFAAQGSSSKSVTDESVRGDDDEFTRTPGMLPHPDQYWHMQTAERISPPTSNYIPSPPLSDPHRESYV